MKANLAELYIVLCFSYRAYCEVTIFWYKRKYAQRPNLKLNKKNLTTRQRLDETNSKMLQKLTENYRNSKDFNENQRLKTGDRRLETGDQRMETREWRPENGDQRLGTREWIPENGDQRVETGDWRLGTGD